MRSWGSCSCLENGGGEEFPKAPEVPLWLRCPHLTASGVDLAHRYHSFGLRNAVTHFLAFPEGSADVAALGSVHIPRRQQSAGAAVAIPGGSVFEAVA